MKFDSARSATYRDPLLRRLKQSVIVTEKRLRRNRLSTNHRGELGKDSNRSQHQPDKTRFVEQVVYSNIKRLTKDRIRDSDEGLQSLINVVHSSGEPLVTKQQWDGVRIRRNVTKILRGRTRIFVYFHRSLITKPSCHVLIVAKSAMTRRLLVLYRIYDTPVTAHDDPFFDLQ
jgi:hypothetical protein